MQTVPPSLPAVPPQRPKSILIFGIFNVLFGVVGLLGALSSLFYFFVPAAAQGNPMMKSLMQNADYVFFTRLIMVPAVIAAFGQIICGIGLFRSREWGRKLAIGLGCYLIITSTLGAYLQYTYLMPAMLPEMTKIMPDENAAKIFKVTTMVSAALGVVFGVAYAVLQIVMLMRAKVRVYCIAASAKPDKLVA
jgi:hypothetical protein